MPIMWIDVEDLFDYARHCRRPSGIQRVAFEVQKALVARHPQAVRFLRHGRTTGSFTEIPFADVENLFAALRDDAPAPPPPWPRRLRRRLFFALPAPARAPARRVWASLIACRQAIIDLTAPPPQAAPPAAPGGWFIMLGSPWSFPNYAEHVAAFSRPRGLKRAVLVYDLIAIRRPEWCENETRKHFLNWFHTCLPHAEAVFAISKTTAADIEAYHRETGFGPPGQVHTLPLGTGYGTPTPAARTPRLPPPGAYALIVATIEARKNHLLLFRIWRDLLETMPPAAIPTLVLAGRTGWLVQDLLRQLKHTAWLNGKITLIENPTDAELTALYQGCQFTLYPSLAEGFGLPITESLSHGAPCLTSSRGAMREAGGDLAFYCDPEDFTSTRETVRQLIQNPAMLAGARQNIAAHFRPTPWSQTAAALTRMLDDMDTQTRTPPLTLAPRRIAFRGLLVDSAGQAKFALPPPMPAPPPTPPTNRLALTLHHLRAWYRDVARDLLPIPARRAVSATASLPRRVRARRAPAAPGAPVMKKPAQNTITLSDAVYLCMLSPQDGQTSWQDLITSFLWSFKQNPRATLLLKLPAQGAREPLAAMEDLAARCAPFACRIILIAASLTPAETTALTSAATYYVNTAQAETLCPALIAALTAGKPALTPAHPATASHITPHNAFIISSSLAHDGFASMRPRPSWSALAAAYRESFLIVTKTPANYEKMSRAAAQSMRQQAIQPPPAMPAQRAAA